MDLKSQLKAWADARGIQPISSRAPVTWIAERGTFHDPASIRPNLGADRSITSSEIRKVSMQNSSSFLVYDRAQVFGVRSRV